MVIFRLSNSTDVLLSLLQRCIDCAHESTWSFHISHTCFDVPRVQLVESYARFITSYLI